jgi:L-seryl-tRNA(Ser) seleniumtransferase
VERLLAGVRGRVADATDPAALAAVARAVVAEERARLTAGAAAADVDALADDIRARLAAFADPLGSGLTPVLNATGVILHTNLGRAPWPTEAIEAAIHAAAGYSLLEFDRDAGRRGPRFRAAEAHLIALTGAEDALVTVNNAAALALAVGLAGRRGVAVSRGELVEIGGGVRIPEIVRRAGARLVEVGTTNRTRAADFEGRCPTAARPWSSASTRELRQPVVEAPDPVGLARLAHERGAIVVDDPSGCRDGRLRLSERRWRLRRGSIWSRSAATSVMIAAGRLHGLTGSDRRPGAVRPDR